MQAKLIYTQGYDVVGIHMSNWNEKEEKGYCTGEEDRNEVSKIASFLKIDCHYVEVRQLLSN